MAKRILTNTEVIELATEQARQILGFFPTTPSLYGIPRGGVPAAYLVAGAMASLDVPVHIADTPGDANILIDDLVDSGRTRKIWQNKYPDKHFFTLVNKECGEWKGQWVVFPWERTQDDSDESITDNVLRMLQYIGEDVTREGLKETPARVTKAWTEWFQGYNQDASKLFKSFTDGAQKSPGDEMIVVHNIPVYSHCEHHLAPIFGNAHIAYIPTTKILGLSKFVRVVECFMRRVQVQERLTHQIADAFMEHLQPQGVGVVIKARHLCMESRGVRAPGTLTTTSAMRGLFRNVPTAKTEFMSLIEAAEKTR